MRASFIAASTLSVPELQKKTLSKSVASVSIFGDLGLQRDLVQIGAVDELPGLLLYCFDEGRVPVAQGVRGDPPDKVQIAVAFVVEEPAPSPPVGAIFKRL